jgi:flagellar biosynthesis/type III secretory pathway protein FliH
LAADARAAARERAELQAGLEEAAEARSGLLGEIAVAAESREGLQAGLDEGLRAAALDRERQGAALGAAVAALDGRLARLEKLVDALLGREAPPEPS